jgi:hypothetical protein
MHYNTPLVAGEDSPVTYSKLLKGGDIDGG